MEASTRCAFALCVPWIERESKKVAKVDQQLAEARDGKLKEQLAAQLQTVRATRDAMIDKKLAEQEKIQREFDGYKETKLIQEALKKAKNEKARGGMEELFSRKPAAGGASAADGASSLDAVNQKEVADKAAAELVACATSAVLTELAGAEPEAADDPMEVDQAAAQRAADFADF